MIKNLTTINKASNQLLLKIIEHFKDQDIWRWKSRFWIGLIWIIRGHPPSPLSYAQIGIVVYG